MLMPIFRWIIVALWLVFIVYWAISAFRTKRTVKTMAWWRQLIIRLAFLVLVIVAAQIPAIRRALRAALDRHVGSMPLEAIGTLLVAFGIAYAITARAYLGRNWGIPMSRKENPELITSGPYALVRHPIYTGILVALLGSAVGYGLVWLLPLVVSVPYFVYSARREEALMCEQFPAQYPAYMRRTKMLLPFVL